MAVTPRRRTERAEMKRVERPRVGVSLLVVRNGAFLAGRRLGSHGQGEWGTPGGHQEFNETCEETALRELHEECGDDLTVTVPRYLCTTNVRDYVAKSGRHYVDVAFVSHWTGGEPKLMEPRKCAEWRWLSVHSLPPRVFAVVPNLLEAYRTGRPYFA